MDMIMVRNDKNEHFTTAEIVKAIIIIFLAFTMPNNAVHRWNPIVASSDQKTLYSIGSGSGSNSIYKFSCGDTIDTCEWTETGMELQYGRRGVRAFLISDDLATTICN